MTASALTAVIPPQPYITDAPNTPLNIYCCSTTGQRIVYGTTTGVIVRSLPDQISFQFPPVEAFFGVKEPICAATMSSDNSVIAGGDGNGTVYVWIRSRVKTKQSIYKIDQMQYVKIRDIAISPDGQRLAIGGVDRYAKKLAAVILADAGNAVGGITGHTKGVTSVQFRPVKPHTIVSAGLDGQLILHDGPPYKVTIAISAAHPGGVYCARFSPDGNEIASCGADGTVAFWNSKTLARIKQVPLQPKKGIPISLAWSPDSSKVAVLISITDMMAVVSQHSYSILQEIKLNPEDLKEEQVRGIFWSRQKWIGVAFAGGHIRGFKIAPAPHEVKVSIDNISSADADEAFDRFVKEAEEEGNAADEDKVGLSKSTQWKMMQSFVKVSDAEFKLPSKPRFTWFGHKGSPSSLSYHRPSGTLAVGTQKGALMFLSTIDSIPTAFQVSKLPADVTVKSIIMTAKFASAVTSDGSFKVFRVVDKSKLGVQDQAQFLHTLEVVSGEEPQTSKKGAMRRYEMAAEAQIEGTPLKIISLDKDRYVGVFTVQGALYVFNVDAVLASSTTGSAVVHMQPLWFTNLPGRLSAVSATTDGTLMAVAMIPHADYPLTKFGDCIPQDRLVNAKSSQPQDSAQTIESPHSDPASMLESFLASGGCPSDRATGGGAAGAGLGKCHDARPLIEIYEIDTAEIMDGFRFIYVLDVHNKDISSLALNDDGSLLASTDSSRNIRVTEIGSKEAFVTSEWKRHQTRIVSMDWSPDGSKLISASTDNDIYVWDFDNLSSYVRIKDSHSGGVNFAKFLFNNMVASGGSDGLVKFFDIEGLSR